MINKGFMEHLRDKFDDCYTPVPESGCWLFDACGGVKARYGSIWCPEKKTMVRTNRLSYELHHGPIPPRLVVRHRCDVSWCVNPDHLELGTQADNVKDTWVRGRGGCRKGASNGRSKLTHDDVLQIKGSGKKPYQIAAEYQVSWSTAKSILSGESWQHVEYDPED